MVQASKETNSPPIQFKQELGCPQSCHLQDPVLSGSNVREMTLVDGADVAAPVFTHKTQAQLGAN